MSAGNGSIALKHVESYPFGVDAQFTPRDFKSGPARDLHPHVDVLQHVGLPQLSNDSHETCPNLILIVFLKGTGTPEMHSVSCWFVEKGTPACSTNGPDQYCDQKHALHPVSLDFLSREVRKRVPDFFSLV